MPNDEYVNVIAEWTAHAVCNRNQDRPQLALHQQRTDRRSSAHVFESVDKESFELAAFISDSGGCNSIYRASILDMRHDKTTLLQHLQMIRDSLASKFQSPLQFGHRHRSRLEQLEYAQPRDPR